MQRISEVETARRLMTEGREWSAVRWLLEKKRVREAADRATAALARAREQAAEAWSDELWTAYEEAAAAARAGESAKARNAWEKARDAAKGLPAAVREAAKRIHEADLEAFRCTAAAEEMFAEAERKRSISLAREAARKALESYDLREKAVRKALNAAAVGARPPAKP